MPPPPKIITVGISPCWDITCKADNIQIDSHGRISSQTRIPAGKALNVSRALAWMKTPSTASGLWADSDYTDMQNACMPLKEYLKLDMALVPGLIRNNITLIDTQKKTETHLRSPNQLATAENLLKLKTHLEKIVTPQSICVFSGSLPDQQVPIINDIFSQCSAKRARIILDSSAEPLRTLVKSSKLYLIKPNVHELKQIINRNIKTDLRSLLKACQPLLNNTHKILLSRGSKGAMLIMKNKAFNAKVKNDKYTIKNTVAAGDYLLAGYLHDIKNAALPDRLKNAVLAASARVFGLNEKHSFQQVKNLLKVDIDQLDI
jgi:1-phosphofructokinase family hexose kinase